MTLTSSEDGSRDVLLWVASDGHVSMNATFSQTMTQFLDKAGDSLKATLTTNTADHVAGRIFTEVALRERGHRRDASLEAELPGHES